MALIAFYGFIMYYLEKLSNISQWLTLPLPVSLQFDTISAFYNPRLYSNEIITPVGLGSSSI